MKERAARRLVWIMWWLFMLSALLNFMLACFQLYRRMR